MTFTDLCARFGSGEIGRRLGYHATYIAKVRRGAAPLTAEIVRRCVREFGEFYDAKADAEALLGLDL